MTYTELEMNVLNILADEHVQGFNTEDGVYPHVDTFWLTTDGTKECGTIFDEFDLDPKIYRGVISSLDQKGAIVIDEYETSPTKSLRYVPMVAIAISQDAFNSIRGAA